MVRAGQLRRRIAIQTEAEAADAGGQLISTWTTDRTMDGQVVEKGGGETIRGDQVQDFVTAVVIIREPRSGTFPTAKMRVQYTDGAATRTLNIQNVQRRDNYHRTLWLYCREDD